MLSDFGAGIGAICGVFQRSGLNELQKIVCDADNAVRLEEKMVAEIPMRRQDTKVLLARLI